MTSSFDGEKVYAREFEESAPISTYLYCMVVGPFVEFKPNKDDPDLDIPLRLFCRTSLSKYFGDFAQDWFRVTRAGIKYYEKVFSTAYPFGKFD
jgi:aminopeptidase N